MKTHPFPVADALKYGTPLVFIGPVACWFHVLVPVAVCLGVVLALVVAFFTTGILHMISKGEIVGSYKPWIALLVVACLAAASPLVYLTIRWVSRSQHRARPEYALEVINQIQTREDLERNADYFTPAGKELFQWLLAQRGDRPMSNSNDKYAQPIIRGDTCDIAVRSEDGTASATYRLIKTDHWRIHDLYVNEAEGKNVGIWLSYAKDHPYATAWTLLWR